MTRMEQSVPDSTDRTVILFDGDCGICTRLAQLASAMDREDSFDIVAYQRFSESALRAIGLDYEACSQYLRLLTTDGRILSGAVAVNYFAARHFPWSVLVALVYLFPPLLLLEMIGYQLVARHRTTISGWLGLTECKVGSFRTD